MCSICGGLKVFKAAVNTLCKVEVSDISGLQPIGCTIKSEEEKRKNKHSTGELQDVIEAKSKSH